MDDRQENEKAEDRMPPRAGIANERFAANVRRLREAAGLSQGEVARRMAGRDWPYYQQTVARVEDGRRKPGIGEAQALASILGATVEQMTLPGEEAEAVIVLERAAESAERAWLQIALSANDLLSAQRDIRRVTDAARAADWYGSDSVRRLAEGAAQALARDPHDAVLEATDDGQGQRERRAP